ncbi:MAG TPA: zinc-binding dehydrogenase [Burkholderiales bacterium]|jgi:NADPH:quinone reductase-like Zn-dependent oxidoreductase|nr:zinc-binding dehydrogenase [Burkholderiales bacterium]
MKAYVLRSDPDSTRLELREKAQPQPGPSQVLVRIRAASLNRGELIRGHGLVRAGSEKPAGMDAAGEVIGTGERVMGRLPGAFAEFGVMDRQDAIAIPPGLSFEEAAAVPITFLVVYDMLVQQGSLKAGEWLLVAGVSAGVGVAALQAGKALAAKVIGTSGSAQKLERLKSLGLDLAVQTRRGDFHDAVMKATGGNGVNLVVNNVGGTVFPECIRSLAYEGRLATVGYLDGVMKAELDLDALHAKRLRLFGVSNKLRTAPQRAATVEGFKRDFLPLLASGRLKPLVDRVYDFADLPKAKEAMEADAHVGKIVVRVG